MGKRGGSSFSVGDANSISGHYNGRPTATLPVLPNKIDNRVRGNPLPVVYIYTPGNPVRSSVTRDTKWTLLQKSSGGKGLTWNTLKLYFSYVRRDTIDGHLPTVRSRRVSHVAFDCSWVRVHGTLRDASALGTWLLMEAKDCNLLRRNRTEMTAIGA